MKAWCALPVLLFFFVGGSYALCLTSVALHVYVAMQIVYAVSCRGCVLTGRLQLL